MRRSRGIALFAAVCCLLLVGGACAKKSSTSPGDESSEYTPAPAATAAAAGASQGTVDAADQSSDGMSVVVKSVKLTGGYDGFIAWHKDENGTFGTVVGHSDLIKQPGSDNVKITFTTKIASGKYWPMLHLDMNKNGTYDFPGADAPAKDPTGPSGIAMKQITVTVA